MSWFCLGVFLGLGFFWGFFFFFPQDYFTAFLQADNEGKQQSDIPANISKHGKVRARIVPQESRRLPSAFDYAAGKEKIHIKEL